MKILGISCYYHDSAACLVEDGQIIAAAQEERFSRKKHDADFPHHAVRYCLGGMGDDPSSDRESAFTSGFSDGVLEAVAFYEKPLLKFHRILETYLSVTPRGLSSFVRAMPLWLREKLWIPFQIRESLAVCGIGKVPPIHFVEHHESHAASAFYPSPFDDAAVVTLDGVGEWATTTIGAGEGNRLQILEEIRFPHSLGLLYSAFTHFTGFRVNSGEYKLMGLAPYGEPTYVDRIRDDLIDLRDDGSFRLNMDYFGYLGGLRMTNRRFAELFGGPPRRPETRITRRETDLARSIQTVIEEAVLRIGKRARSLTGKRVLAMAGGVALNCVANGKLLRSGVFDDLWIQPAAGDAGGALGAALGVWHNEANQPRRLPNGLDAMRGSLLGPEYTDDEIRAFLDVHNYPYRELPSADRARVVAELLAEGFVIGHFNGRMEFGPRALGNRSILGDARSKSMQSIMNLKIKYRESFRPFAPSVLAERASEWFELDRPSPYMLIVADVAAEKRFPLRGDESRLEIEERLNRTRSAIPAVTHVDDSARIQTVHADTNPDYYAIVAEFERLTGCPVLVNTSLNLRGEPIACTPRDAVGCFLNSEMDCLLLGSFLLSKRDGSRSLASDPSDQDIAH